MDAKGEDVSKTELTLWTENEAEAPLKYTDYKPKWSGDQLVRYLSEFEMVVCVMCRYALNEPPGIRRHLVSRPEMNLQGNSRTSAVKSSVIHKSTTLDALFL